MNKIVIYMHSNEILIVANADNVDLICEYVGLLTNIPFPKCGLAVTLITAKIKSMRYQFEMVGITFANAMQHIA